MRCVRTLFLAATLLTVSTSCGRRSTSAPVSSPSPVVLSPPPQCLVVMGPPEPPPISFRSLSEKCRHPDGSRMRPDDLCMTSEEVSALARFAAVSFIYAVTAWRACSAEEEGAEAGVRVLR